MGIVSNVPRWTEPVSAEVALRKSSAANQTPQERSRVMAGACWCGQPTQGDVTGPDAHRCSQCAEHCAVAAYRAVNGATVAD